MMMVNEFNRICELYLDWVILKRNLNELKGKWPSSYKDFLICKDESMFPLVWKVALS